MKTYVIAEVGPNHNGNVDSALKYVKELSKLGCSAIKFQHGKPNSIFSNQSFFPKYQKKLSNNFDKPVSAANKRLLKNIDQVKLFNECKKYNIDYICSAFDLQSIKFLNENTHLKYFKIPSGEILSLDILDYIRRQNKPIILSTGMATDKEISFSIDYLNHFNRKQITLLHCISSYPTKDTEINLQRISILKEKFNLNVGLSDHTSSKDIPAYSIYAGAKLIEKHVTFNKNDDGPDHRASLEIEEFKVMLDNIKKAEKIFGGIKRTFKASETNVKNSSRKSITAKRDINKGQLIKKSMITFKRPGTGISPNLYEKLLNKTVKQKIKKNDLILWKYLK